jgi:hypothetical protein
VTKPLLAVQQFFAYLHPRVVSELEFVFKLYCAEISILMNTSEEQKRKKREKERVPPILADWRSRRLSE